MQGSAFKMPMALQVDAQIWFLETRQKSERVKYAISRAQMAGNFIYFHKTCIIKYR